MKILFIIFAISFLSCKHAGSPENLSAVNSDEGSPNPNSDKHNYKIEMVETKLSLGALQKTCEFKYVYPVVKMLLVATRADLEFIESVNDVLAVKKLTPKTIKPLWYDIPCIKGNPSSEIEFESKNTYFITEKYVSFLGDFWTYTPGTAHPVRSVIAPVVDAMSGKLTPFSQIAKPNSLNQVKEAIQAKADQKLDTDVTNLLDFVKSLDDIQFTATPEELILHISVNHVLGDVYSPGFSWDEAQVFLK